MEFEHTIVIDITCQKCGAPLRVEQKKHKRIAGRIEEQIEVWPCNSCLIDAEIAGIKKSSATAQRILDKAFAS